MQKKIIALAIAGLVSGAAFAQSNVTVYGIADMSYAYYGDANAPGGGTTHRINSGQWKGSRFGFKGSEDLGDGLSAVFQMELGMSMDVNAAPTYSRASWVGLKSSSLGELKAGNFATFQDDLLVATSVMFGYGTLASPKYVYLETTGSTETWNISNAVHYYSPIWNGFQVKVGASTHGTPSVDDLNPSGLTPLNGNNRILATAVQYTNGPFIIGATYEYNKYEHYSGAPSIDAGNTWNIAAAYDFGVARIGGAYGTINYAQSTPVEVRDSRAQWHLGVSVPVTPKDTVAVNYAHAKIDYNNTWSDDTAGFWGVGYLHSLSKRTSLYASYGDINQDDSNHTKSRLDGATTMTNAGYQRAFAVGIRHDF